MNFIPIKGTVFFISREKFKFLQFLEKIEWVSKNAVFFSWTRKKKTAFWDELVSTFKLFQGKKKQAVFFFRPLFVHGKKKQKFSDLS